MLRSCIQDILLQSYKNIAHGVNLAYDDGEDFDSYRVLLEDVLVPQSVHYVGNINAHQHTNHVNAITSVPNFMDYDLFIKIDDDDIYKRNYVQNIVDFFAFNKFDICSSSVIWQLNGYLVRAVNVSNLGGNPPGTDFNMPPTFVFNRKALLSILDIEISGYWEDKLWRYRWVRDGLMHIGMDNRDSFVWNIHGNNISTSDFLNKNKEFLEVKRVEFELMCLGDLSINKSLDKVWVYNADTLVLDFVIGNFRLAFDVKFSKNDVSVDVLSRNISINVNYNGAVFCFYRGGKIRLFNLGCAIESTNSIVMLLMKDFLLKILEVYPESIAAKV